LIGKQAFNPFTNKLMPIIADESVDPKFQTGAVKITPSHDFNDYEMHKKHNLPLQRIFDDNGCLDNVPEEYMVYFNNQEFLFNL
jgi:valyl-tRNA synthetase